VADAERKADAEQDDDAARGKTGEKKQPKKKQAIALARGGSGGGGGGGGGGRAAAADAKMLGASAHDIDTGTSTDAYTQAGTAKLDPYAQARVALSRMSGVSVVVGREQERSTIETFLEEHITQKTPASMYISGKPGTGKTATVTAIINGFCQQYSDSVAKVSLRVCSEERGDGKIERWAVLFFF
jgi:ATP-dependent Clp protease ATP-binding subunit ClpA